MKFDRVFKTLTLSFAIFGVMLVFLIGAMLFKESWPALSRFGAAFFTGLDWNPVTDSYGAAPFIYGTVISALIAMLIAVPLSLGIAIFLSEWCPFRLRQPLSFLTELLAAIPSVIYGLWGVFVLVPLMRTHVQPFFINTLGFLPLFQGPPYGIGLMTAGVILAIMIVPIISSICFDIIQAVPRHQREAALALGATPWETVRMVLKYGRSGIVGAVFLGLGRAVGETMAVTMLIGNRADISASLFAPAYTMASVIANEFAEAATDVYLSVLMAVGLTLFLFTLIINGAARFLIWRVNKRFRSP